LKHRDIPDLHRRPARGRGAWRRESIASPFGSGARARDPGERSTALADRHQRGRAPAARARARPAASRLHRAPAIFEAQEVSTSMKRALACLAFVLVWLPAATGWSQAAAEHTGTVASVQTVDGIIVLEDGRQIRVLPATVVLVDGQPVAMAALAPGTRVVIRQGQAVSRAPAATTTTEPQAVTVQVPAPTMTVQIPRQTVVVEQAPPQIMVTQPSPEVVVRPAPAPQVVQQGAAPGASAMPRETVQPPPARTQAAPAAPVVVAPAGEPATTTVRAPASQVTVQVPRSRIVVEQQPPQITVQQQPPEVVVQPAPPPQVQVIGARTESAPAAAPRAAAPPAEPRVAAPPPQPPAPAASPATAVRVAPAAPWCAGAYSPQLGTNFGQCPGR
jgi:hypothetical protein